MIFKLKESGLFLKLCAFKDANASEIKALIEDGCFTDRVLGMLLSNRVAPIAYGTLIDLGLIDCLSREYRNTLRDAALIAKKRTNDFTKCISEVSDALSSVNCRYAMLKGAYLAEIYPKGYRTSNDIDILVAPDDVSKISASLKNAGFSQGYIKNGNFVPATRQQIIESKMTRGETVPFIKRMELPFTDYLEVDINFSLDYKNSNDTLLNQMLQRSITVKTDTSEIQTLDKYDFLLHLCSHLYKEATTLPWIRMRRDMTLYKYVDIYYLLHSFSDKDAESLIKRAEETAVELELAYCLKSISAMFPFHCRKLFSYMEAHDGEALDYVVAPMEKKLYVYKEPDPLIRFFTQDRAGLLLEVSDHED